MHAAPGKMEFQSLKDSFVVASIGRERLAKGESRRLAVHSVASTMPRTLIVSLVVVSCFATACHQPRRTWNWMVAGGAEVAHVSSSGPETSVEETTGGAYVTGQVAHLFDDWVSVRARADLGVGGNANDLAGRMTLDAQLGFAFFDGADHLFARGVVFGTLEGDPVTGLYLLELPALWFGYEHHDSNDDRDSWHLDVGPRLSFVPAARALAPAGERADIVAAPGLGWGFLVMGEIATFELTYMSYWGDEVMHVVRGSACLSFGASLCVETRHVITSFGEQPGNTGYVGVRFGAGFASGLDR